MEIANGVHLVDGTNANVYILLYDNLTIVDTGMPGQLNKILDYIKSLGKKTFRCIQNSAYTLSCRSHG
jgi:glyoxylase-like metal-dependent hydrolase (beta-lactamase superfamily II)